MIDINKKPSSAGDRNQNGTVPRGLPTSGVILPVVLTLLVQASVSMSAVAIPVFMPVAAGELNIPPSYVGIFMSLIYLAATAFAPVSGYFIDRFGPICVSQFCLILCALGLGAFSIPAIPMMIIGALIMGIGYGPVTPASSHLLVRTTPFSMMSVVFSIKQTGVPIGGAMAGAIVPHLVIFCGWKMSALVVGALSLILSISLHHYRKQFDTERSKLSRLSWKNVMESIKMTVVHPELRYIVIASFFFSTMQLCLVSFIVTYLIEDVQMTLIQAGILLATAQAGGIIGRIVWGALADRCVKPRLMLGILGIAMTAGALSSAAFSLQWPFFAVLIVCALFGAAAIGWNGVFLAEVARVAKPELTAMATGGSLFFTFAGILVGLPAFSLIVEKSGSYPLGFGITAVATFVCGMVLLFSHKSR
ncbi:MAG: MFS transporter [Deltaproteobacteria bacterium]|nr:MFS transporter [Deltaproteobacteria bacterium]